MQELENTPAILSNGNLRQEQKRLENFLNSLVSVEDSCINFTSGLDDYEDP